MKITPQTQCHPRGCVSACLAMLLNRPVEEVTAEFHEKYMAGEINMRKYLTSQGVELMNGDPEGQMYHGHVYLVSVPSLNLPSMMHEVLMDLRDDHVIFDPNVGYEGRKYYTLKAASHDENAVPLSGFCIDYRVISCPAMGNSHGH